MMQWPPPPDEVLEGEFVRLSRVTDESARELQVVLDDDEVWRHAAWRAADADEMARNLGEVAERNGRFPWVVTLTQRLGEHHAGDIVGSTSFFDASIPDERLEIGYTAYARWAWGSVVNPECKLLLMGWAFEVADAGRVQLKTDLRNIRSQEAIARLGAVREGVLRRHQRRQDGSIRDSVMFSVIREEWPAVRAGLEERLGR